MKLNFYLIRSGCLGLLCFLTSYVNSQTTYYVSSMGSDAAAGTSSATPWKTLSKVSSTSFSTGDIILFRRGDEFLGQLKIVSSGVTIDAYGSGEKPVISGAEQITNTWTINSGNIWECTFTSNKPAAINNLFHGSLRLPISRYPNKAANNGYLNFESHSGLTQITDSQLGSSPVWTGADVVVRSERFRLNRTTVTSHSGSTLTIPSMATIENLRDGYGYFFVNDLKAIDTEGEWAYKSGTGKLYLFSGSNPNSKTLYFPRRDTLVYINGAANVSLKNIKITRAGKVGVLLRNSAGSTIDGIEVTSSGGDGIIYNGCAGGLLQNSAISYINNTGVWSNGSSSQLTMTNNIVSDIGDEAFAKSKTFIGIDCNSPNSTVSNNTVSRTGYTGIISAGLNNLVKRNVVDSACLALEDMGGIYTNYNVGANNGMIIEENIVTNSIGEMLGAPGEYSKANGIYVDNMSTGVTVRNNTVAFIRGAGLFANANRSGNEFHNNTAYSCGVNEFSIYKPVDIPQYQISGNILVSNSKLEAHKVVNSDHTEEFTYQEMGSYTANYIISPFTVKPVYVSYKTGNGIQTSATYSPYEWETASPEISGTTPAPIAYSTDSTASNVIKFYYNKTSSAQTVYLPVGRFINAQNEAFCSTTVLQPFTSLILFKAGNGSCVSPSVCSEPGNVAVDSIGGSTAVLSWNGVNGSMNFDLRYKAEADTIWKYAHNIQDTTFKLLNLKPQTYYEYQLRTSCYGAESSWKAFPVFKTVQELPLHVFINADYTNCGPASAFASIHSDTDNKWTLQNSGGIGTVDKDMIRSSSVSEDAPEITLTVTDVLDSCSTYDVYLYYLSPVTQPWKTKARLSSNPTFITYDRNTSGAELLADNSGSNSSNRLFRAKLGTVSGADGFSVILDDINYGTSSSRSVFDGVGYIKVSEQGPLAPDSLTSTAVIPNKVNLQWRDLSLNETAYIVERREGTGAFSAIAILPANSTSFQDSVPSANIFTYRIYASNGTCRSSFSNQSTIDYTGMVLMGFSSFEKSRTESPDFNDNFYKQTGILVYPNPTQGVITLEIPSSDHVVNVLLRDLNGNQVCRDQLIPYQNKMTLDIKSRPAGMYILEIDNRGKKQYYKVIKN